MKRWCVLICAGLAAGCVEIEPPERVAERRDAVIDGESEPDAYGFALAADVKNAMIAVSKNGAPHCSGTIIGDRLVVSAGHCFVGNSQAWLAGADPEPLSSTQLAAMEIRVGPDMDAPECVFTVAQAILNPMLALRDLDLESAHANPHDSALVVLEESVLEKCPSVWPGRIRLTPLTDAIVGQEGIQGGFGATTDSGLPTNYERRWSHFTVKSLFDLDVQVKPLDGSYVWHGDSGSGVLIPTEDGNVEVIAAVSNLYRHARLDVDAQWITSQLADDVLCGPATGGSICVGDALVSCAADAGLVRSDCTAMGLECVTGDDGAECGCSCDACDASCECATAACEEPVGGASGGEADDEGGGCAIRGTESSEPPSLLLAVILLVMVRRARRENEPEKVRHAPPRAAR